MKKRGQATFSAAPSAISLNQGKKKGTGWFSRGKQPIGPADSADPKGLGSSLANALS
jgi:hypothetical protein